jgi:hypothetical protein
MNLAYCQNGQVVAQHPDDQNVPASAYGTGTRIIPLPADVVLVRDSSWPAPPAGTPDSRPFLQPTETKELLLGYAAQIRFQASVKGISFTAASGVIPVHTDRESQTLINNLATYAPSGGPTTAMTFTQDNVQYAITHQEAINMFNAVLAFVQSCRDIEGQCITDLNSVTPTILAYADVDARFSSVFP